MGELRQIVYLSRAAAGCHDEEARQIGYTAQQRNRDNDVTGLLLFDGHRFIQAIEGPADAIQDTFDRICADERHNSIQLAADRSVERRQFGSWSMQVRKTSEGACSVAFLRKIKDIMLDVDDASLQALFIGFTVMGIPRAMRERGQPADPLL